MSATSRLPDTLVLCRAQSGMPEHTTETEYALGHVASVIPKAVE